MKTSGCQNQYCHSPPPPPHREHGIAAETSWGNLSPMVCKRGAEDPACNISGTWCYWPKCPTGQFDWDTWRLGPTSCTCHTFWGLSWDLSLHPCEFTLSVDIWEGPQFTSHCWLPGITIGGQNPNRAYPSVSKFGAPSTTNCGDLGMNLASHYHRYPDPIWKTEATKMGQTWAEPRQQRPNLEPKPLFSKEVPWNPKTAEVERTSKRMPKNNFTPLPHWLRVWGR